MGHDIIPLQAGRETFGWLVAAFLLGTFAIALFLRVIVVLPISRIQRGAMNWYRGARVADKTTDAQVGRS